MAITAATIWEVQTTGSDANGGGYDAALGGADYSTGSPWTWTDIVADGSDTITSATGNFAADMVGNTVSIYASGVYTMRQIVTRTDANTLVLDATVASGSSLTMVLGGPLASIGRVGQINAGAKIWLQSGTYSISSASMNVPGGGYSKDPAIEGYASTRGDLGTKPILQIGIDITTVIGAGAGSITNLKIDCDGHTINKGLSDRANATLVDVVANGGAISGGFHTVGCCQLCFVSGATYGYLHGSTVVKSTAQLCYAGCYALLGVYHSVTDRCEIGLYIVLCVGHCLSYGGTIGMLAVTMAIASLSVSNTTDFWNNTLLINCAHYGGAITGNTSVYNLSTCPSGQPLADPTAQDFSLSAAGLADLAWALALPGLSTTTNEYIGAVHPAAGGGSTVYVPIPFDE